MEFSKRLLLSFIYGDTTETRFKVFQRTLTSQAEGRKNIIYLTFLTTLYNCVNY